MGGGYIVVSSGFCQYITLALQQVMLCNCWVGVGVRVGGGGEDTM